MSQFVFGAGTLWGTPLTDYSGSAISVPSPIQFGTMQSGSVDMSCDLKELYGGKQFPVAVGRGKGKITGKATFAQLNGSLINSLFFGQTLSAGIVADYFDVIGAVIPATPFQITPTVPSSGTWSVDLGVRSASGLPMTRVASGPTTGQYSVAAGVYTFATADVGQTVFINYQYTATSTTAQKSTVINVPMGYAPSFRADFSVAYAGKTIIFSIPSCISTKLSFSTKLDDFAVPEFDFSGFEDPSTGNILTYSLSDK
ncbi:MAG: hypothetical protein WCH05_05505 [Chlorobiaceae bacterium]